MSIFLLIVMIVNISLGFWLANKLGMGPGNPIKLLIGSRTNGDSSDEQEALLESEEKKAA